MINVEDRAGLYRKTFSTGPGKKVLADLLEFGGLMSNGFDDDPRRQERMNGQRDMALYILDSLGVTGTAEAIAKAFMSIPSARKNKQQEAQDG